MATQDEQVTTAVQEDQVNTDTWEEQVDTATGSQPVNRATLEVHLDWQEDNNYDNSNRDFYVRVNTEHDESGSATEIPGSVDRRGETDFRMPKTEMEAAFCKSEDARKEIHQGTLSVEKGIMHNESPDDGRRNTTPETDNLSSYQNNANIHGVEHHPAMTMMKIAYPIPNASVLFPQKTTNSAVWPVRANEMSAGAERSEGDSVIPSSEYVGAFEGTVGQDANESSGQSESSERDSTEMSSERIETEDGSDVDEQETPVVKRWSIAEGDEKSLVPNDHIGAVERSDVNAPKAVAQGNETEDICNRGYYIGHSSDSQDTGESTQVFPIALKQVRVNLHVTKEIEQLHRKYLQEQRERNQMMSEGEMGEGIEISSQQYSARRLTRQKNSGRRSSNTKKQMIEDETLELEVDEIDDIDMRGHRFTKSSKPKRLKKKTVGCSKCPKTFRFRSRLVLHMERSHGDAKPFQCKTCQKGFARSSSLRSHRRRNCSKPDKQPQVRVTQSTEKDKKKYYYYSRVERVTCNLCGRSVRGPKMLKKHMQSHEVHKCEHCPKQFSQPTRLKYHLKMVHGDERPFKCEICGKAFAVPFLLKRHLPSHQEQKEHRCETCHKIYKSADTLRKHRVMHSENRKTYVCEVCGNVYKSRDGLTKHAQLHMQLTFTCDVCGATFKKSDYLRDHKNRMHPAEGTVQLRGCETCGKMFRCGLALRRHQRLHKVPENNVMCEECGKTFKHKKSLNYHMLEHTGERPHKCQYCDRDFKDLYACKNHIKSVHCNERPYSCEYCDKTFSNRKVLRCHEVRFHSKTPVIICGRCGKFFKSETALRRHQKTELGQEAVMCELCGKVLVHKQSLMKHLKTHTTQQTHDCVFCEEQFPSRSDLLTHISSQHSSEEPVACNICDRVSRSKVTHDQHMQRVHSSDLYQCALCGKSFKSKKSRRFHMKVHLFQNLKC